jgi:hypothetical protein
LDPTYPIITPASNPINPYKIVSFFINGTISPLASGAKSLRHFSTVGLADQEVWIFSADEAFYLFVGSVDAEQAPVGKAGQGRSAA